MKQPFLMALSLVLAGGTQGADSTMSPVAKFAYSGNVGWINFRPEQPTSSAGIVFSEYFLFGHAYAGNVGWIDFGNGAPANGIRYQNNGLDFGVNHDGLGNLSGYAYSANTGWINFGWATLTDPERPRVDLATGFFSGYAYSGNLGWINLGGSNLVTVSMSATDADSDGIADAWERIHFGDLTTATATSDFDQDGATDKDEYLSRADPRDPASYLKITSTIFDAGLTQATVVFTTDAARFYRLETIDAFNNGQGAWVNSALGAFAPDPGATTTKTISWPGANKKFIRAVAIRPLQP